MIDMVKRDVDARLDAMKSAERHRVRLVAEAKANPVCRVKLGPKPEYVTILVDGNPRVLRIVGDRIYSA